MKKLYDAVVTTGTYTDKQGAEKKRYLTVGAVFENDKGMSLKLESLPVGQWNGWVAFYPPKDKTQKSGGSDNFDDDAPF